MNREGFIPIKYLAGLRRVQRLTEDINVLQSCCKSSSALEVKVEDEKTESMLVRRKEGWEDWIPSEKEFLQKEALEEEATRVETLKRENLRLLEL